MATNRNPLPGKRLDSWKEIAAFLGRAERTVKRWETERGLPVHRVPGGGRSAVFAYGDELSDWLKGRTDELDADDSSSSDDAPPVPAVIAQPPEAPAPTPPTAVSPGRSPARVAAWIVPLLIVAGSVAYFSLGHRGARFKALASRHAPNDEAQDLYLKGRYYWDRRTPDDLNKAIDYFTQAIVKDPSDAQAYVGLADCYNLLREFGAMSPADAYPRALSAAHRAVELDDSSADAHLSLAFGTYWWSWHAVSAELEFKRALELNPGLVRAHHWYATFLFVRGRQQESFDQLEQARQLDPSSAAILADRAYFQWITGHNHDALDQLKQLSASQPSLSSTHDYLGQIYWEQKDYPKSLAERRTVAQLRHDADGLALADAREKGFAANGLQGLYQTELPVQKEQVDRGAGNAYSLATTYAALGRKQEALACLQTSFDRREAGMLIGDAIPELLDDPQYKSFRNQVAQLLTQ